MSHWNVVYYYLSLVIFTTTPASVNCETFCGSQTDFLDPKGFVGTSLGVNGLSNCSWSIRTPTGSVVYLRIEYLKLQNQKNCINISSLNTTITYLKLCSDDITYNSLTIPTNELLITMQVNSESYLGLTYLSYIVNCPYEKLHCRHGQLSDPNLHKTTCVDGTLSCGEFCKEERVICHDNRCYDIDKQRCDGVIDCLTGEDELACHPDCPNQIRCPWQTKCVTPEEICNQHTECSNGFDESNCPNSFCQDDDPKCTKDTSKSNTNDLSYFLTITFGIMTLVFVYLLCKCLARRQSVRDTLDNPLDVPLPPFRGPGEGTSVEEVVYQDDDFRPGGEIYESFAANLEKIKQRRRCRNEQDDKEIMFVKPPEGQNALNKYFSGVEPALSEEMAALATIKITRNGCYGLRKARSEEKPMTRMLFIDVKDDQSSESDSEAGDSKVYRAKQCKSDTDYVRRCQV